MGRGDPGDTAKPLGHVLVGRPAGLFEVAKLHGRRYRVLLAVTELSRSRLRVESTRTH